MVDRISAAHGELLTLDSAEEARGFELQRAICDRLRAVDLHGGALDETLRQMQARDGDAVYSEALQVLCHLRFAPDEAKQIWRDVVAHRSAMQRRLGSPLDLRVALFSYLVDVERKLDNPKIIELSEFEHTRESAYTDQLTGLRNYRYFAEQLNHEVLRADQYGAPLSLIMMDIDHFKQFNDRNGHEAGNEVLRRIGATVRDTLRKVDIGARYGGEEFAVLLPSTTKAGGLLAAERLRAAIEAHESPGAALQPLGRLTASLGVATYPADAQTASEFVEQTDRALYRAKAEGRNRVHALGGMRSFPRVCVELDGRCRVGDLELPLRTIQIGTGGMSFRTTTALDPGAFVEAKLALPPDVSGIALSGRVLRVTPGEDGWVQAALCFIEIVPADRRLLSRFVRNATAT